MGGQEYSPINLQSMTGTPVICGWKKRFITLITTFIRREKRVLEFCSGQELLGWIWWPWRKSNLDKAGAQFVLFNIPIVRFFFSFWCFRDSSQPSRRLFNESAWFLALFLLVHRGICLSVSKTHSFTGVSFFRMAHTVGTVLFFFVFSSPPLFIRFNSLWICFRLAEERANFDWLLSLRAHQNGGRIDGSGKLFGAYHCIIRDYKWLDRNPTFNYSFQRWTRTVDIMGVPVSPHPVTFNWSRSMSAILRWIFLCNYWKIIPKNIFRHVWSSAGSCGSYF